MNATRTKRLKRILAIEQKKLEATKGELKRIQFSLQQLREKINAMKDHIEKTIAKVDQTSIDQLRQTTPWSILVQDSVAQSETRFKKLERQRDELQARAVAQRSAVRGWQLLVEKLDAEDAQIVAREALIAADDNFLRKQDRRAR